MPATVVRGYPNLTFLKDEENDRVNEINIIGDGKYASGFEREHLDFICVVSILCAHVGDRKRKEKVHQKLLDEYTNVHCRSCVGVEILALALSAGDAVLDFIYPELDRLPARQLLSRAPVFIVEVLFQIQMKNVFDHPGSIPAIFQLGRGGRYFGQGFLGLWSLPYGSRSCLFERSDW